MFSLKQKNNSSRSKQSERHLNSEFVDSALGLCSDEQISWIPSYSIYKFSIKAQYIFLCYRQIGSAVLNGGFSTFLAFFLLAFSDAYAFNTFFKVKQVLLKKVVFFWNVPGPIFCKIQGQKMTIFDCVHLWK